jgi:hypothetical protein
MVQRQSYFCLVADQPALTTVAEALVAKKLWLGMDADKAKQLSPAGMLS